MHLFKSIGLLFLASATLAFTGDSPKKEISKPRFMIERIAPAILTRTSANSYLADFGRDAFGTLELSYRSQSADTLIISLGEKLLNGQIDRNPGGTIRFAEVRLPVLPEKTAYSLQLKADKRNTGRAAVQLPDSFGVVMPFRYAEIRKAKQPITPADLRQKAYFHRFDDSQSSFASSDTVLNQVWNLCKYSIKATSFTGIYIDGDRERIAYEADAYINQLGHYCTDNDYEMAQTTIAYFMDHPTWPTEWLLHTALMAYQDYYYTGNTALIKQYWEQLKAKTLIDLAREDGLISTVTGKVTGAYMRKIGFADSTKRLNDIVDWPPAQKDSGWKLVKSEGERDGHEMMPVNTVVNCFFYENMKIMAELAGALKKKTDQARFAAMAAKVREAINQKLFDRSRGVYLDGEGSTHASLHSNMVGLAFGLVPEKELKTVTDFVKSRGMACSVYGAQYLLEGLYRSGEGQYALELMRATTDRSWWNMIRSGSTITMEAWDMKYKPNSDWNHAWGAAPANIIPRWLWGIQPKVPGFGTTTLFPRMGNLTSSTIRYPTRLGAIRGEYRLVGEKLKNYAIELPANMIGEFCVNWPSEAFETLNGKKVDPTARTVRLQPGMNRLQVVSKTSDKDR